LFARPDGSGIRGFFRVEGAATDLQKSAKVLT
jgi:hypothetical protein